MPMRTLFLVSRARGRAWDAAKPLRAQPLWDKHAAFMDGLAADGFVVLGGPIEDSDEILLVVRAASEDDVRATLARDPWSPPGILELRGIRRWNVLLDSRGTAS
jgi:uncharacterized protein YciI